MGVKVGCWGETAAYSAILTALAVTGTTTELKRWWKRCAQYMRRVCIHRCAQ